MRVDDQPDGGLLLRPARDLGATLSVVAMGAALLALAALPRDRALAFAASTTLAGVIVIAFAAGFGAIARTADVVRRIKKRGFVGTVAAEGHYREAPRQPLAIVDGERLDGEVRVEVRRDRPPHGAVSHPVFLVGARYVVLVDAPADAQAACALARRLELALGLAPARHDPERELRLVVDSPATALLLVAAVVAYLGLAFALAHWLFARPELLETREPLAPLCVGGFGATAYWAWSKVGAAAARERVVAEFTLRR